MSRHLDVPADNAAVCGHNATLGAPISPDGTVPARQDGLFAWSPTS